MLVEAKETLRRLPTVTDCRKAGTPKTDGKFRSTALKRTGEARNVSQHTVRVNDVLEPDPAGNFLLPVGWLRRLLASWPKGEPVGVVRNSDGLHLWHSAGVYSIRPDVRVVGGGADVVPDKVRRPALPKWAKGTFEVSGKDAKREVHGQTWECFGIARIYCDGNGKPEKGLTHLPTGMLIVGELAQRDVKGGIPAYKRFAAALFEQFPDMGEWDGMSNGRKREVGRFVSDYCADQ